MANLRIIHDNAAERATITASTTVSGGLAATSLATNSKSLAHRSTGTTVTYTLNWSASEQISGVILPATNLSSAATIRVVAGTNDSGSISACISTPLDNFVGVKNVNSFPYGGLSKTAVWFTSPSSVTSMTITLTDTSKGALGGSTYPYPTYIDCSRIVCGKYWEPSYGVSKQGLELTIADTTQTSRSDAGDLFADRGTIHDQLSFNLDILTKSDKEELVKILRNIGNYKNIAVSIFPENNSRNEQDYIIYGKRETSSISYLVHNYYSNSFSITGW